MSMFYCQAHQRLEDSDHVGYNKGDLCDEAMIEKEDFEQEQTPNKPKAKGKENERETICSVDLR